MWESHVLGLYSGMDIEYKHKDQDICHLWWGHVGKAVAVVVAYGLLRGISKPYSE